MNLHIRSKSKRLFQIADMAVPFYAEQLNLLDNRFDLYVYPVRGLIKNHDARGMCQLEDPVKGRKQIVIWIDSGLKFDAVIQVLAHEMIHVKQMVKGHYWFFVDDYDGGTHFWLGKQVEAEYWDRPWEKEAWSKEKLLAAKFEHLFYKLLKNA
jgi:hypothetical protein